MTTRFSISHTHKKVNNFKSISVCKKIKNSTSHTIFSSLEQTKINTFMMGMSRLKRVFPAQITGISHVLLRRLRLVLLVRQRSPRRDRTWPPTYALDSRARKCSNRLDEEYTLTYLVIVSFSRLYFLFIYFRFRFQVDAVRHGSGECDSRELSTPMPDHRNSTVDRLCDIHWVWWVPIMI